MGLEEKITVIQDIQKIAFKRVSQESAQIDDQVFFSTYQSEIIIQRTV